MQGLTRTRDLACELDLMIVVGALNPMGGGVDVAVAPATGKWPTRLPLRAERVRQLINDLPETGA